MREAVRQAYKWIDKYIITVISKSVDERWDKYLILFTLFIVCLTLLFLYRKEARRAFELLGAYSVIVMAALVCNPLSIYLFSAANAEDKKEFYLGWLILPVGVITSYVMASRITGAREKSGVAASNVKSQAANAEPAATSQATHDVAATETAPAAPEQASKAPAKAIPHLIAAGLALLIILAGADPAIKQKGDYMKKSNTYKINSQSIKLADKVLSINNNEPCDVLFFKYRSAHNDSNTEGGTVSSGIEQYTGKIGINCAIIEDGTYSLPDGMEYTNSPDAQLPKYAVVPTKWGNSNVIKELGYKKTAKTGNYIIMQRSGI